MWTSIALGLIIATTVSEAALAHVTCKRAYQKVGCFRQKAGKLKSMLINDRDVTSGANYGHILDWSQFEASIHSLACRCSQKAREAGFTYFAIAFWAECYGGKDEAAITHLLTTNQQVNQCKGPGFRDCVDSDAHECVGKANADYIYKLVELTEDIDGGYSDWSEFSPCTKSCGGGTKSRERTCTNPPRKGKGKDCSGLGEPEEVVSCNNNQCPVNGGFTAWGPYSACSATCGDGTKTRQRTCTKPAPANGGNKCVGETTETVDCKDRECPIHGRFTEWGNFGRCSKTCGRGEQKRTRTCIGPKHGGNPCMGDTVETKPCNAEPCPVDGKFGAWGPFGKCSASCGGGLREAKRECNNPEPAHGGKACVGSFNKFEPCNQHSCRVDGQWSQWSSYSTCDKPCGCGKKHRTRTCTNPAPQNGGSKCPGLDKESEVCHVKMCTGVSGVHEVHEFVFTAMLNYYRTSSPASKLSGKFFHAIFEIQRAAGSAMISDKMLPTGSSLADKLEKLKVMLKTAVDGGSASYARRVLGITFYAYIKLRVEEHKPVCGVDSESNKFVEILITFVGHINFKKIISEQGDATLMFTIDTTGSMADEIQAAKTISINIINDARDYNVDYILSPFSDPGTGPVTYRTQAQRGLFTSAIGALRARGGGDCPELAMGGILNALRNGPRYGSPMFVFTDASAKDGTAAKIQEVKAAADASGATLYFFMNPKGCSGRGAALYRDLASHTGGQFFALTSHRELVGFSRFVASSLETDTMISSAATVTIISGKRSVAAGDHQIFVDKTITKLIIAVSVQTSNSAGHISLKTPKGAVVSPVTTMSLNRVYTVDKPESGTYVLNIPASCGKYEYSAKGISVDAIAFGVGFVYERDGITYSLDNPLDGFDAEVAVKMAGIGKIDLSQPFFLRVLNPAGHSVRPDITLTRSSAGDDILKGTFRPPAGTYRLVMHGTTKAGEKFEREAKSSVTTQSAFLAPTEAGNGFSAKAGVYFGNVVRVTIYTNKRAHYSISAKVDIGTVRGANKSLYINGKYVLSFEYFPRNGVYADKGKTATIQVSAVSGSERISAIVPILLV